jgi:hypothetical protein
MSNAFMALIWWVIPLTGLLGALGYVVWVTQFKSKFESETSRSVGQFQRFQDSFRTAEVTSHTATTIPEKTINDSNEVTDSSISDSSGSASTD